MNREIKYRAYIKNDYKKELIGKILDVSSIHLKTKKVIIGYSLDKSNYGNKSFSFDDIELMQYTGLHDKNGKEIYEGDIVKITGSKGIDIGKVIYEYNGFTVDVMNMDRFYGRVHLLEKFTEVIGNIYDNPELLGGE